jgi:gag-polypeptide of LTR copia-type
MSIISLPQGGNAPSAGAVTPSSNTKGHPHLFNIPYLKDNGNNFVFWKYQVQIVLELWDLWGIIDGTTKKPDSSATAKEKADWESKDQEACMQISLTLKDEPLNSVLSVTSAKQCWEKLSAYYKGQGEQCIQQSVLQYLLRYWAPWTPDQCPSPCHLHHHH